MEAVVRPPIFVLDREGWVSVFESVSSTEAGLETPDVETGEYVALDAAGRPLVLTVVEGARTGRWYSRPGPAVRLAVGVAEPRPELLRTILEEAVAGGATAVGEDLQSLIERARRGKDLRAARSVAEARAALTPPVRPEGGG